MTEKNEVSIHEVKTFAALLNKSNQWLTNSDIVGATNGVALRTVRAHTFKLVKLGILDQAEVFPSHRYKLSEKANRRNPAYLLRLSKAAEVFGVDLNQTKGL